MMKDFLQLLSRHFPGSIPAGILFLRGERLKLPGFGWAPATWASGYSEDYPYPLSRMEHGTELVPEGLLVRYPGIMLHCEEPKTVMSYAQSKGFDFPVDRELNDWYRVEILFQENRLPTINDILTNRANKKFNYMLAVIISRPQPKERLAEIGLLVEIYDSPWRRHEKQVRPETILYSRVLSRIRISRIGRTSWREPKDQVIGERTRDDQLWCVDDYSSNLTRLKEISNKERRRGDADGKAKGCRTHQMVKSGVSQGQRPQRRPREDPSLFSKWVKRSHEQHVTKNLGRYFELDQPPQEACVILSLQQWTRSASEHVSTLAIISNLAKQVLSDL
ncbi:hypothetical protein PG997_001645 [Apiospora hydei]|uniref:Uncharacterized protein n=1 Tax=Apiospora hydei TaxID=1337664 RepID=A0ABR1XE38_9PEZI